jgi:hypothetical protein
MLQRLLLQFIKSNGRKPNNLEMILLRQKASKEAVNERKIVSMFDRQPVDANKPILGGKNIIETDEQMIQRFKNQNQDSINRIKDNKEFGKALKEELMKTDNPFSDLVKTTKKGPKSLQQRRLEAEEALRNKNVVPIKDPPEELAGGGVAGLLGERSGYKNGKDVFIGPRRKKKTKKELEDEKILKEKIAAYLESQTINLPEEDPLKKYQPTDYSLYGGFMDNIKMKGDRTGNIINDFNNISIDPKDARVGISRFNPKTDSSFVAGAGPSGFNIGFKKQFSQGGPARQNFKMGKRAFLKLMGGVGAGIAGLKSGLLGLGGKQATKKAVTETVKQTAGSGVPPPYFFKLVDKIKTLGDDAPKLAVKDREVVTKYKDYTLTEDITTGEKTIQRMKIDDDLKYDASEYYGKPVGEEVYMSYRPGKGQADETMKGKTLPDEYTEDTSLIRSDRPAEGEVMDTFDGVPDDILKEVEAGSGNVPESFYTGPNPIKKADGGLAAMLGE